MARQRCNISRQRCGPPGDFVPIVLLLLFLLLLTMKILSLYYLNTAVKNTLEYFLHFFLCRHVKFHFLNMGGRVLRLFAVALILLVFKNFGLIAVVFLCDFYYITCFFALLF